MIVLGWARRFGGTLHACGVCLVVDAEVEQENSKICLKNLYRPFYRSESSEWSLGQSQAPSSGNDLVEYSVLDAAIVRLRIWSMALSRSLGSSNTHSSFVLL